MPKLCIAVHDDMLAAALAVPRIERLLNPQEVLRIRAERYQDRNTSYPSWYLFGCPKKQIEGFIVMYSRLGADVSLCPESKLTEEIAADIIDTQFCTVSEHLYQLLYKSNKTVYGYLPENFSSKTYLAEGLLHSGGQQYIPCQKTFSKASVPLLPESNQETWIVKSPYGSAGKNCNGTPYTVWRRHKLIDQLPLMINKLQAYDNLICSEFVTTNDPYAENADHVVHKMPFIALGDTAKPYGTYCQKFIHHCNWQLLHDKAVLTLDEFVGIPKISVGTVDKIAVMDDFVRSLSYHRGRVMLSIDFIIPPDGIPRFLESNKLAATFAERFDPYLPPMIDFYANQPFSCT